MEDGRPARLDGWDGRGRPSSISTDLVLAFSCIGADLDFRCMQRVFAFVSMNRSRGRPARAGRASDAIPRSHKQPGPRDASAASAKNADTDGNRQADLNQPGVKLEQIGQLSGGPRTGWRELE